MAHGRRDLFVLFVVGILLPGAILAVFGFRSLRQDRLLAERQTRIALESTANLAAREVTRDLAQWPEWKEPDSTSLTFTSGGMKWTSRSAKPLLAWASRRKRFLGRSPASFGPSFPVIRGSTAS